MVKEALQVFPSVCAIIMVGVAYGAPRIKAAYGDVLVSKFIHGVQDVKTTPGVLIARSCNTSTIKVDTDLLFTFSSHNFPEAFGGEMEGVEVLKITQEYGKKQKKNVGVIIIKGVADFADDEKPSGKHWQYTAAMAAASYAQHKLEMTNGRLFTNGKFLYQ